MAEIEKNDFKPNYAVPPGETLKETLESLGMTQAELAQRTGRPKKTINEIIKGKATITPDTAIQLERALGVPASFWNNLERNYQETLALLIPPDRYQVFIETSRFSEARIRGFAKEIDIAPGIVAGRLQHDKLIPFAVGNALKKRFKFREENG
jgi:addiction module HigA family antidote